MNRRAFLRGATVLGASLVSSCSRRGQPNFDAIQRITQDIRIADLLHTVSDATPVRDTLFRNVSVLDPDRAGLLAAQAILTRGGAIVWTGPGSDAPSAPEMLSIDGAGRIASPGLADMHVHTQGMGEHLLRLAAGVTTVRDMDGFPWLLQTREAIDSGRLLGATTYVAGTIIADHPLFGYATVVKTPEEARQIVRAEAQCGYSFIKVHNRLAQPLFDAVAHEAKQLHIDLVGHVPHDITIAHAVGVGGMRTLEHLKGFLIDQTLLPSDEDYGAALGDAEVWITPTLYTRRQYARGAEAEGWRADPRMRYAPRSNIEQWIGEEPAVGSEQARLGARFVETQRIVMERLVPLSPRWLAGTDAAGYAYNLAGYSLHDEMALMRAAGISNSELVRSATTQAASAMRASDFGRIVAGARADIVLLSDNPLNDVEAYRRNEGVMARGRWLAPDTLNPALEAIAAIYAEPALAEFGIQSAEDLAHHVATLQAQGLAFEGVALAAAGDALEVLGHRDAAASLQSASRAGVTGACDIRTPN